jgi:hypothetical protein
LDFAAFSAFAWRFSTVVSGRGGVDDVDVVED